MGDQATLIKSMTCGVSTPIAVIFVAFALFGAPSSGLTADKSALLTEVHFDPGSTAVTPGGRLKIKKAIAAIKEQNPSSIRIIGFTDSTGDEAINRKISYSRAENVASLLAEQGITIPMVVEGKGETGAPYKIKDNTSEPLNRCVGIIAVSGSKSIEPML